MGTSSSLSAGLCKLKRTFFFSERFGILFEPVKKDLNQNIEVIIDPTVF